MSSVHSVSPLKCGGFLTKKALFFGKFVWFFFIRENNDQIMPSWLGKVSQMHFPLI